MSQARRTRRSVRLDGQDQGDDGDSFDPVKDEVLLEVFQQEASEHLERLSSLAAEMFYEQTKDIER